MSIVTNTKIDLVSKALILLGEKALNSLDENRYGAQVGANLFELIYENELSSNRWRFAMSKVSLSRLTATPLNQWQYAFQLPTDMILPVGVYPSVPYEIYGTHLYTDSTAVDLEYQFKPDVGKFPSYFSMLLVYALARDMVNPITGSDNKIQIFQKKYTLQRDRAMYADAQGRPPTEIVDSPFVNVRF